MAGKLRQSKAQTVHFKNQSEFPRFYKHLLDGGRVDRIEAKKPKGLAPKTVRNIHQMIGSAYSFAMPHTTRRMPKGLFSTAENSPFEAPRERKGLPPLDPRDCRSQTAFQLRKKEGHSLQGL